MAVLMPAFVKERRRRARLGLQCLVRLRQPDHTIIEGRTLNLSSEGVFWVSAQPFALGERIRCSIWVLGRGSRSGETACLDCRLQVVRVEKLQAGFGLGCRIEDYVLVPGPSALTLPA